MAAIHKIQRVQVPGVLHDFSWPPGLDDFQNYNLIYGLNGSGKTTLSNIFRCLELKKCDEGQFTIGTDGVEVCSANLESHAGVPQVKVFNQDFVSASVFTTLGTCCPIFFLGEDSAAKQNQIELLKAKQESAELALSGMQFKLTAGQKRLEELQIDTAATIKELLRSPGVGNRYNTYDKRNFVTKCEAHKKASTKPTILTDVEKTQQKALASGAAKPRVQEVTFASSDIAALKESVEAVLSRNVVSEVIQALKDQPDVNSWAEAGLKLHQRLKSQHCLFCELPLPVDRIEALEKHFSDEYAAIATAISTARANIASWKSALTSLTFPDEARVYNDLVPLYRNAVAELEAAKIGVEGFLTSCDKALEQKQSNPFEIVALSIAVPTPLNLSNANEQLRAHNDRTSNFEANIKAARAALEEALVGDRFDRVIDLERDIASATAGCTTFRKQLADIRAETLKLDGEIKEHRRPAEQINSDLASYLGRKDITLAVEEGGYRIMRDGTPATRLSEGEKTALAVIYFLKSLEDKGFDRSSGIVVIDDPVSSLDANALFYAFSFIQERTKDVGQLFLLTHNFGFLRLVRKWFFRVNKFKKKLKKEARLYMLNCMGSSSGRRAVLATLDPLLSEYESEYSYLFSQIVKGAEETVGSIEKFYHYPNIARRVLEAFLAFRLPNSSHTWEDNRFASDMHTHLHELGFDSAKTNRILNFLHTHSHNARPDGSVEHDESILLETPSVLSDVIQLIEHADSQHCAEMKKLVSRSATS